MSRSKSGFPPFSGSLTYLCFSVSISGFLSPFSFSTIYLWFSDLDLVCLSTFSSSQINIWFSVHFLFFTDLHLVFCPLFSSSLIYFWFSDLHLVLCHGSGSLIYVLFPLVNGISLVFLSLFLVFYLTLIHSQTLPLSLVLYTTSDSLPYK